MPVLPAIRVHALVVLERELRRRGPAALVRAAERAAALVREIEPEGQYPVAYVIFRVLGERADVDGPVMTGTEAVASLCALVERLTEHAGVLPDHALVVDALDQDTLARRWRVSRKTLDRMRRQGLPAIRVRHPRAHSVLRFPLAWVARYEDAHADRLARASAFARVTDDERARMLRRAERYQRLLGMSLNQVAARLATRFGRSHEGVRQLLFRAAKSPAPEASPPVRAPSPQIRDRQRRVLARAWRLGFPMRALTARTRRTPAAIRRALALARRDELDRVLARMPSEIHAAPTFTRADAPDVLLAADAVREDLFVAWPDDLRALLELARDRVVPVAADEAAQLTAARFLAWRCARARAALDDARASWLAVDAIEADMLWIARLRSTLVRTHLTLTIETLEGRVGTPLAELPPAFTASAVRVALGATGAAVDAFDPFGKSGAGRARLAAAVGLAVDRAAAVWLREHPARGISSREQPARATRVLMPGHVLKGVRDAVLGPAAALEPAARVVAALATAEPSIARDLLARRYGLPASARHASHAPGLTHAPICLGRLARDMGLSALAAGRLARVAYVDCLTRARAAAHG
jgi:hypothetical protein